MVEGSAAIKYLRRFFDRNQLKLIEAAFEGWGDVDFYGSPKAREFYDAVVEDEDKDVVANERLRLIMENIIANKGTFVPDILPQRVYVTPGFKG